MKQTTGKFWFITIPAVFMTAVVNCYILVEGFGLPNNVAYIIGIGVALAFLALFLVKNKREEI